MSLSDTKIRSLKPKFKPYKASDEKALYMLVTPSGGKLWRYEYRYGGKRKTLALGKYPGISLKYARAQRDDARALLDNDIDPSQKRKIDRQANRALTENTFEIVGREWYSKRSPRWSKSYCIGIAQRTERDIYPWLGNRPIAEIEAQEVLTVLRRIEARGANETAHWVLQLCSQIFRYGVATGKASRDPCGDLRGALAPVIIRHFAAITKPDPLALLLRDIRAYQGTLVTRTALNMLPYVFTRPGELRRAEWAEIDILEALWTIPGEKLKTQRSKNNPVDHVVPLSTQVLELLEEIRPLTGHGKYVFPGARSIHRSMSENALLAALRNLGYDKYTVTPHGFRATARTLLDEVLGFEAHLIEHQLAHSVRDANGRAYNRTAHLPQRIKMMQTWADYLDSLAEGGKVISFRSEA